MEWAKILGALIVIACSSGFGWIRANEFGQRPRYLAQIRSALAMLESEIVYGATPLGEACQIISKRIPLPLSSVFEAVGTGLEGRQSTAEVWHLAWHSSNLIIRSEDLAVIGGLGSVLGASDRVDQLKHLKLTQERLSQQEQSALDDRLKHERMWRYLGSLGGLAVVLAFW